MSAFPHVFRPVRLRHKTLTNRIVFGAHTTNMAEGGLPGAQHIAYYVERAIGGAAMIVVEPMPVHPATVLTRGNFKVGTDEVIAPFRRLTDACKAHGAVMIQQLYHIGAHGDGDNSWHAHWSPSGGPSYHDSDGSHEMSEAEIEETIEGFVTAESHIRTPENANTVLGAGEADLVSIVRGQIADPHLVAKAEGGRAGDIRGCISCNQQCWGRRGRDYYISCLVNPSAGHEYLWGGDRFEPATAERSVLVVGGGPAGLEAARVAAARGHRVTLAEAGPEIGGQFRLAGLQPRRGQITDLIGWYGRQLDALGVDLRFNTLMDAADIAAFGADRVILATGSLPAGTGFQKALPGMATLPGLSRGNVWPVEEVMMRAARPGHRVVVLDEGGNWRGCGTAWRLAEDGHAVTLVTPDALVGKELQRSATDWPLRRALARLGVRFVTDAAIREWTGAGAVVQSLLTGATEEVAADALVMATANIADPGLRAAFAAGGIAAQPIGDASAPRNAAMAIYEGRRAGLAL